jgi:uncharacterized protein YfaT (DUF1175 family)
MKTVSEIQAAIEQLSCQQYRTFCAWFAEYDSAQWDRQIAEDIAAGKLNYLADEAVREHKRRIPRR